MPDRVNPLPHVSEREFDALRRLMDRERNFPASYDAWQKHWAKHRRHEARKDRQVLWIDFLAADFEAFCKRAQMLPSWDALAAFIQEQLEDH